MNNPYTGGKLLSFKVSDELATMIDIASVGEHRNRSELIRRAIMLYLEQGEYFKPGLDSGGKLVEDMLERAREELDGTG